MKKLVQIVDRQPLAHGFHQIILEDPIFSNLVPGQYIVADDFLPCALLKISSSQASTIISPNHHHVFQKDKVTVSPLMGDPLSSPDPAMFYLFTATVSELPSVLFYFKQFRKQFTGLVFIQGNGDFPFAPHPSKMLIPYLPSDVTASIPLLEDWKIPHRLANLEEKPGCFHGTVETLVEYWRSQSDLSHSSLQAKIPPIKL